MIRVNIPMNWYNHCVAAIAEIEKGVNRKVLPVEWQQFAFAGLIMVYPDDLKNNSVVTNALQSCATALRSNQQFSALVIARNEVKALWDSTPRSWLYQLYELLLTFDQTSITGVGSSPKWAHLEEQIKTTCRSVVYFSWQQHPPGFDPFFWLDTLVERAIQGCKIRSLYSS